MAKSRVIIGMPQSRVGSTFLRRILNAHPEVHITEELRLYRIRFWPQHFTYAMERVRRYPVSKEEGAKALREAFWKVATRHPHLSLHHRSVEMSRECVEAVEAALMGDFRIIGDKGYLPLPPPSHRRTATIEEALELFPDTKVLFLYRHPFDTFTSCARMEKKMRRQNMGEPDWSHRRWDLNPYWDMIWNRGYWRQSVDWAQCMERWERIWVPGQMLGVRFEVLLAEPKRILPDIADFLELDSVKPILDAFRKRAGDGHVGYWKERHPEMAERVHPDIFPVMERFGYSP